MRNRKLQYGISLDYSCCDENIVNMIDDILNDKNIVSSKTKEIIGNHDGVFCNEQMDNKEALKMFVSALNEVIGQL